MDSNSLTILSLCSGVGGLDLGIRMAQPNAGTVCYVEIEAFACEILATRMEDKALDEAPIWTDLRTFDGKPWRGIVDCITAGYPCQPFSVAGKQKGKDDPRHLWPEVCRIVEEIKPRICFFENVGGHLRLGFEQVHDDLQGLGYKVKAGLFSAEEVGASHKRERLFIMAYRESDRTNGRLSVLQEIQRETGYGDAFEFERSSQASMADCEGVVSERPLQKRNRTERSEMQIGSECRQLADTNGSGLQEKGAEFKSARTGGENIQLGNSEYAGSYAAEECGCHEENDVSGRAKSRLQMSEQSSGTDILADTDSIGAKIPPKGQQSTEQKPDSKSYTRLLFPPGPRGYWEEIPESLKPAICRMDDGMATRVDRIRACGNGVVPLAAAYAWLTLFASIGELK